MRNCNILFKKVEHHKKFLRIKGSESAAPNRENAQSVGTWATFYSILKKLYYYSMKKINMHNASYQLKLN